MDLSVEESSAVRSICPSSAWFLIASPPHSYSAPIGTKFHAFRLVFRCPKNMLHETDICETEIHAKQLSLTGRLCSKQVCRREWVVLSIGASPLLPGCVQKSPPLQPSPERIQGWGRAGQFNRIGKEHAFRNLSVW